ncbi:hypothetical protein Pflav_031720 [Phytohabitans flavus]|uniref:Uncharacterized protein n=1 Tax=Phytohabitans flavus TaxID=1076124 RepID=A0A6F8XSD5_9ACTN|nr:hypothetical protein Pflav_031720 [Phytohabitans flavus]
MLVVVAQLLQGADAGPGAPRPPPPQDHDGRGQRQHGQQEENERLLVGDAGQQPQDAEDQHSGEQVSGRGEGGPGLPVRQQARALQSVVDPGEFLSHPGIRAQAAGEGGPAGGVVYGPRQPGRATCRLAGHQQLPFGRDTHRVRAAQGGQGRVDGQVGATLQVRDLRARQRLGVELGGTGQRTVPV